MTNPYPVPWQAKDDTYQQINGGISEDDWIGLWYKHFTNNPKLAFRDLFYLGYCGKMKDAISPQIVRLRDIQKTQKRTHYTVHVFGASCSGKSSFIKHFLNP